MSTREFLQVTEVLFAVSSRKFKISGQDFCMQLYPGIWMWEERFHFLYQLCYWSIIQLACLFIFKKLQIHCFLTGKSLDVQQDFLSFFVNVTEKSNSSGSLDNTSRIWYQLTIVEKNVSENSVSKYWVGLSPMQNSQSDGLTSLV